MNIIAYLKKYNILQLKDNEILVDDGKGLKLIKFAHEYEVVMALDDMFKRTEHAQRINDEHR